MGVGEHKRSFHQARNETTPKHKKRYFFYKSIERIQVSKEEENNVLSAY